MGEKRFLLFFFAHLDSIMKVSCPTSGLLAVGRCRQAGDLSGANLVRLQKLSGMQAVG